MVSVAALALDTVAAAAASAAIAAVSAAVVSVAALALDTVAAVAAAGSGHGVRGGLGKSSLHKQLSIAQCSCTL